MTRTSWLLLVALWMPACTRGSDEPPTPEGALPADVFGAWDGVWSGRFRVLLDGEVQTELQVVQKYTSDDFDTQIGLFDERDLATGEKVRKHALNTRRDGALRCRVTEPDGTETVHQGRWTGEGLEWFRKTEDLEEHFFEVVTDDPDGQTYYVIEGWGRYGGGPKLRFEGRYRKVGSEKEARHLIDSADE